MSMPTPEAAPPGTGHLYGRFSDPKQARGDSRDRQLRAGAGAFCEAHDLHLSPRVLFDPGTSAFRGLNLDPNHPLGQFARDVEEGTIPPGDALIVEDWDRISRQHVWASMRFVSTLKMYGIHIGRLDRGTFLRAEDNEIGGFIEAAVAFARAHDESVTKAGRIRGKWEKRRQEARQSGKTITKRLPAWILEKDGKRCLVPQRKRLILQMADWALQGVGLLSIVRRLTDQGVEPWGWSGAWNHAYVHKILTDRRLIGEHQPRDRTGRPEGEPIAGYYPAVLSPELFNDVVAAIARRRQSGGRPARAGNPFRKLLRDARDGSTYAVVRECESKGGHAVLLNVSGIEGRAPKRSFRYDHFEARLLEELDELDADAVSADARAGAELDRLDREAKRLQHEIAECQAGLAEHYSATLARVVAGHEQALAAVGRETQAAQRRLSNPAGAAWRQAKPWFKRLADQPDPKAARERLGALLRDVIADIRILILPRGSERLACVQVHFKDNVRARTYLILSRQARKTGAGTRPAQSWVESFPGKAEYDLRKRADVAACERFLQTLPSE
jgi:DNA invertase Pin-like site-specific DNA recombinase